MQGLVPAAGLLPAPYRGRPDSWRPGQEVFDAIRADPGTADLGHAPISVYCHVPYCRNRCAFCDLHARTLPSRNSPEVRAFVDSLVAEIGLWGRTALSKRPVTTIHFGGGTPTC